MVSICCITYNQEKYIARAIESFLSQKVDFGIEILIHDDASQDRTPEIIMEYANKYPELIKPICNKENQYSKGIAINPVFNYSRAQGKYISLCEGDDYFTDKYKLYNQVKYMEKNPDCHLCFHNSIVVDTEGENIGVFLPKNDLYKKFYKYNDSKYSTEEMIMLDFIPTNSMLFRLEDIKKLPAFYYDNISICGDLSIRLYLSSLGHSFGFKKCMSAYRRGTENSASQKAAVNYTAIITNLNGHIKILNDFNQYSGKMYNSTVKNCINYKIFSFFYRTGASFALNSGIYRKYFHELPFVTRVKYFLRTKFSFFYNYIWNKNSNI